ncbi:recombinase family protein [Pedobacter frigoris]|uniref:Recombinase family protein n=1 Tax=Pedobacter frigoris TaxID=2571272 RepID=A0A4U1CEX7_9SPHI|nr:recombinase family protein [Pedobacter frigoris]TKC04867.1 hypothetical protein FA047_13920 [Pedobacter frigoris]
MQTACLYIRVSTDEQAQKGFSQRSQEERLLKYCLLCNIQVAETIFEDFSAKTFNRPQWTKLIAKWRNNKSGSPNMVLFTRWDRFSRNIADACLMIGKLQKLSVQPQAIEQMLDFTIPEHKIMLAVYLAAAEVENDHIALNISLGMHKAREEGRWPGRAPIGYSNRVTVMGDKYITPREPESIIIKRAFETIAANTFSTHYIYQQAVLQGLKCSRSHFWELIRNPVYCGRVLVPQFGKEKQHTVKGAHEKLISVALFEQAQNILNAKGRAKRPRAEVPDQIPLRGFLSCPICHKTLTGSASQGHTKRYFYYHCSGKCRFRARADFVNEKFQSLLGRLKAKDQYIGLYRKIVEDIHHEITLKNSADQTRISKSIETAIERTIKAKDLLYRGDIDFDDFTLIKESCSKRINDGCNELQECATLSAETNKNINEHVNLLSRINELYDSSDVLGKRQLLQLFLPEKITLDKEHFKLISTEAVHTIYSLKSIPNRSLVDKIDLEIPAEYINQYLKILQSARSSINS